MILPRSTWELTKFPVTGSVALPDQWLYNTIHWPGANVNPNEPIKLLQAMQIAWVNSKGYSLGYNFAVFPDGTGYEIRGFDIRCAANGSQPVNIPGVAILMVVPDVHTDPTPEMIKGVQEIVRMTRILVGRELDIVGHRDVRPEPTQCPGDVIETMIMDGKFEPPVTQEEDEMTLFRVDTNPAAIYCLYGGGVRHIGGEEGAVRMADNGHWTDDVETWTETPAGDFGDGKVPADVHTWLQSL